MMKMKQILSKLCGKLTASIEPWIPTGTNLNLDIWWGKGGRSRSIAPPKISCGGTVVRGTEKLWRHRKVVAAQKSCGGTTFLCRHNVIDFNQSRSIQA